MNRKTGYLAPPTDSRDWSIDKLFAAVKVPNKATGSADLGWQVVDVLDQGDLGSCTLNGITQLIRMRERVANPGAVPELGSRLFSYYHTRYLSGYPVNKDTGANPRTAMKAVQKWGLPREQYWPYRIEQFDLAPSPSAYRAAYDQRAPYQYYWIQSGGVDRVEEVKLALDSGYGVGIGAVIGSEYRKWKAGDEPLGPPSDNTGGHFMTLIGYEGDVFACLGSWGEDVADHGVWLFSADYIAWSGTTSLLVIERSPVL